MHLDGFIINNSPYLSMVQNLHIHDISDIFDIDHCSIWGVVATQSILRKFSKWITKLRKILT